MKQMIFIGLYPILLIVANLFGGTFFSIGSFQLSWAVVVFGGAFLITDITKQQTKAGLLPQGFTEKMYEAGMIVLIIFCIVFYLIGLSATAEAQTFIYSTVRIFIASIITLAFSQRIDLYLFDVISKRTTYKTRWIQNNVSTILSTFVDSILFFHLAFAGRIPYPDLLLFLAVDQIAKIIIALLDTPIFLYMTRNKNEN